MTADTKLRLQGMFFGFAGVLAFFNWLSTQGHWRWLHLAASAYFLSWSWRIRKQLG